MTLKQIRKIKTLLGRLGKYRRQVGELRDKIRETSEEMDNLAEDLETADTDFEDGLRTIQSAIDKLSEQQ